MKKETKVTEIKKTKLSFKELVSFPLLIKKTLELHLENNELKHNYTNVVNADIQQFKSFKAKVKEFFDPTQMILINMELSAGDHAWFYIDVNNKRFHYKGGVYVIDTEMKYYVLQTKCYCLDYHQDFVLPIKRHFDVAAITKTMDATQSVSLDKIPQATNPYTLKKFIDSEVIEKVLAGQQLSDTLRSLKLLAAISAIASVLMLIVYMFKSGMLSSVTGG